MDEATEDEIDRAKKSLERKASERLLLIGADWHRYGNMKNTMQLNMALGTNNYPDSIKETMNIMNTHQQVKTLYVRGVNKENSTELIFAQKGGEKDSGDLYKNYLLSLQRTGGLCMHMSKERGKGREWVHSNIAEGWEDEDENNAKYMYHQTNEDGNWNKQPKHC